MTYDFRVDLALRHLKFWYSACAKFWYGTPSDRQFALRFKTRGLIGHDRILVRDPRSGIRSKP